MQTDHEEPAPLSTTPAAPAERREWMLPAGLRSPAFLLVVWILPQSLLLALNLRTRWLVGGEMDGHQHRLLLGLLGYEGALLVVGAGLCAFHWVRGRELHWLLGIPILALHIGYLVAAFSWTDDLVPQSVTLWILPPQRFLFQQFALVMPAAFYGGLRLACFPSRVDVRKDVGLTLAACVGLPILWYLGVMGTAMVTRMIWDAGFGNTAGPMIGFGVVVMMVAVTVLALAAMVRFSILFYTAVRGWGDHGLMTYTAFVALVGPLGGLSLNRMIPFPFDFQAWQVYAITVVNGLLLTLPVFERRWLRRAQWIGVCALYSYTLYFFLVFLPFLPLSLLAMLAFLAGLLMLVPSVLMALQSMRIWDGYRRECADWGRLPATAVMLAAVLSLPALFAGRAWMHRTVLHQAIEHVYENDPSQPEPFRGHRGMLRRTLRSMNRSQQGVELPFLTSAYNQIVFDGLTLPKQKLDYLHRGFFGEEPPAVRPFDLVSFGDGGRGRDMWDTTWRNAPPSTDVDASSAVWTATAEGDMTRALVRLQVGHDGAGAREYVERIQPAAGVFVSGFWLHIGPDRVPGRIFETKTALWVYQKIRDTGRVPQDPAVLRYLDPGTMELRVYPVESRVPRVVEVEFLFPTGLNPGLTVGGVPLASHPRPETARWLATKDETAVMLPTNAPTVVRESYLHFLIDRSVDSAPLAISLEEARKTAEKRGIDEVAVTLANYESRRLSGDQWIRPVDLAALADRDLPRRGGFARDRAIAEILTHHDRLAGRSTEWALRRPEIVVLSGNSEPLTSELEWFAPLRPEPEGTPVTLLRVGGTVRATTDPVVFVPGAGAVEWYADDAWADAPGQAMSGSPDYAVAVSGWLRHQRRVQRGSRADDDLGDMVAASRESGILLPDTTYIVVENSAQWNMLEMKEREKLGAKEAFEFETPAPGWVWMLGAVLATIAWRRRRLRLFQLVPYGDR